MSEGMSWPEMVAQARREVEEISAPELSRLRGAAEAGDLVLIDVREDDEWARGRIPGAIHLPLGTLPEHAADAFGGTITPDDRRKRVVVYCAAGVRSLVGAAALKRLGFENPVSLKGGVRAWAASGGDTQGHV